MKSELIFSGIGGQGTILMGRFMCIAASDKGYNVTLAPTFGQEKRGGRSSCQVVISRKIGSPVISEADTILVMDESSLDDYEDRVKIGGTLIINSTMVSRDPKRNDIEIVKVPFTEIATKIGNPRSSNMVALGVVLKRNELLEFEDIEKVIEDNMKESIVDINKKALEAGYNFSEN